MRVLFADDQLPSPNQSENERYKDELRKEFSGKLTDFEAAYQEDYEWFSELVRHLRTEMGFDLMEVKSFSRAKELAQKRDDYDLAVIDLSWTGDPGLLSSEEKKNAGLEILRLIAKANQDTDVYKPVIAFSQNYSKDPELFARVLETGALPIPKDYTPTGHRTLAAAIRLLGKVLSSRVARKWEHATLAEIANSLTVTQMWSLIVGIVSSFASVAAFAYWLGTKLGL
jgi:DNA-binding NarL/FixJ family response regulator